MIITETLLEKNLLPDWLIRAGIRRLLRERLREEDAGDPVRRRERLERFAGELRASPIAIETGAANRQHYEVPAAFFGLCLGPRRKYSSAFWPEGVTTLAAAEEAMLDLTCRRACLEDGQSVLELGCGWGSLSLFMAGRFPGSRITAVSNSRSQKAFIDAESARLGLNNLEVVTADMNHFDTGKRFDRIVSVEMFEHMRNYQELMRRIASWSNPGALLFVHIFTHKSFAYAFEDRGPGDWMARHFFTGGIMPSDDLLLHFQDDFSIREHWRLDGTHYQKTAAAWLAAMDANRAAILELFRKTYGAENALLWFVRWRVFYMACEELWGYRRGGEWLVSHYLFAKRDASSAPQPSGAGNTMRMTP